MPELPEVETIRRLLAEGKRGGPPLAGQVIERAAVLWPRTLARPGLAEFERRIRGQEILALRRRGKYLRLDLSRDVLLFHLRMSGDLWLEPLEEEPHRHHRVLFDLSSGYRLGFNNARKFGRVWLVGDPSPWLDKLGPEPLDEALTAADFYARLHPRRRRLKPLLLDQTFLAGLGNIYTDEALHRSGLHPLRIANALTFEEAAALLDSIRFVLREGLRQNGASIDWAYRGGGFQNTFQVYQRAGEPCYRCGTPIRRIVVGQRGTHFCPRCQVLPPASPPSGEEPK